MNTDYQINIDDDDVIHPYKELPNLLSIDTTSIRKNYKVGNPKVIFKVNPENRVVLLCFCGDVVKEANSVYRCPNIKTTKSFCGFRAQKVALDFIACKGLIKPQYFLNVNGISDEEEIKKRTEAAKLVFPRCTSCKRCSISMSTNKHFPYIYGKLFFTCECPEMRDRMSIEIDSSEFAHQFDIEKYTEDLKNKREQLSSEGARPSDNKRAKKEGIVVNNEMNDE